MKIIFQGTCLDRKLKNIGFLMCFFFFTRENILIPFNISIYIMFFNFFQPWLFNITQQLPTMDHWALIYIIYDLQPKPSIIDRLWYQLRQMKINNNKFYYKSKSLKIKNVITIKRLSKYLILFIYIFTW